MAEPALKPLHEHPLRKLPRPAQWNWITGQLEQLVEPEQLELPLGVDPEVVLPEDESVMLLATEGMTQLLVAGFGLSIGKKRERLVVRHKGKIHAQVPMLRLQEVIISSSGVSVSSDVIHELCSRGIRISFLTSSGRPYAMLSSPMLTATVETRRAQIAAMDNERGAEFCRWVVIGKLRNQEKLLRYFAKSREGHVRQQLEEAARQIRTLRRKAMTIPGEKPDDVRAGLMGLEGTAGRLYWEQMALLLPGQLGFDGRVHRGPVDVVNAALNYGYGILYSHVWGAVLNAGLEPFAGILHTDRSGKPSMVLDLVEEFRQPVVDRPIIGWLNKGGQLQLKQGLLDDRSREEVAARVLSRLRSREIYRGKEYEIRSIIQMQARAAAGMLRGLRKYRPFTFRW